MILLTPDLRQRLLANGRERDVDHVPVVKFFNPVGTGTWLATELDADGDTLFGLADLGEPEPVDLRLHRELANLLLEVDGREVLPHPGDVLWLLPLQSPSLREDVVRLGADDRSRDAVLVQLAVERMLLGLLLRPGAGAEAVAVGADADGRTLDAAGRLLVLRCASLERPLHVTVLRAGV